MKTRGRATGRLCLILMNIKSNSFLHFNKITYLCLNFNSNTMILSIIVPVYNVEKYLAKCIDSLLQQDLAPLLYEEGKYSWSDLRTMATLKPVNNINMDIFLKQNPFESKILIS